MHKAVYLLLITLFYFIIFTGLNSQNYCIPVRFCEIIFPDSGQVKIDNNVVYCEAINWKGTTEKLDMDIAYPDKTIDTMKRKPLIVFIHGGGYYTGNKSSYKSNIKEMAAYGFVAASISYRTGWNTGSGPAFLPFIKCDGDPKSLKQAVYRAVQDTRAALRFLAINSEKYGIDTDYAFLAGSSAGAITCLVTAFSTQMKIDAYDGTLRKELGALDSSENKFEGSCKIKGVISMWGGIFDTTFIQPEYDIAVLMFHGTKDALVPYDTGAAFSCYHPVQYPNVFGGFSVSKRLENLGKCYELNYKVGGNHGFGLYDNKYYLTHTLNFIKSILCHKCQQVRQESKEVNCLDLK